MSNFALKLKVAAGMLRFVTGIGWLKLLHGHSVTAPWRGWLGSNTEFFVGKDAKLNVGYLEISNGCKFAVEDGGKLIIGNGVFFNRGCTIVSKAGVTIGDDTLFGENVKIFDHDHVHVPRLEKKRFKAKAVVIGKGCWFGSNVIVLKGVTIGDNVTVGANSVISTDITSDTVVTNSFVYKTRSK